MAKKKKAEGKIKNNKKESAVDFTAVKEGVENWDVKTLEAESKTTFTDDDAQGEAITLRFFDFVAHPEAFKKKLPTAQELFNAHLVQIRQELWKDEWQFVHEIEPRLLFARDKSHYRIVIAARPAKGSLLSYKDQEKIKTLSQLAHDPTKNS